MRLISRNRHRHSSKAPRISISQAEITADLQYPAPPRRGEAPATQEARPR
jgi:hypothetical protein